MPIASAQYIHLHTDGYSRLTILITEILYVRIINILYFLSSHRKNSWLVIFIASKRCSNAITSSFASASCFS